MHGLRDFLSANGYSAAPIELDGKLKRFGRNGGVDNAWMIGWQHHLSRSGDAIEVALVGDWRTGERLEYKTDGKLSDSDRSTTEKMFRDAISKAESERKLMQEHAREKAKILIDNMSPAFRSEYYTNKKITELHGTGTTLGEHGRMIVVPMRDVNGDLHGVQKIFGDGTKRFITGQRVSGCFHTIGDIEDASIFVCEGFATGASLRQATKKTIVVAFNAANVVEVCREIKRKYPTKAIVVCGDDDRWTDGNPGRTKSEEAAKIVMGVAVFPQFKNLDSKPTDFNDLYCIEGESIVTGQLDRGGEPDQSGFIPLGFDESVHFFFDTRTRSIIRVSGFTEAQMLELMPIEYWESCYPTAKRRVDWTKAKSDLIEMSKAVGCFDAFKIRGTGVWNDAARTVINTGRGLSIDGKSTSVNLIKSRFVYIETKNRIPALSERPLTSTETLPLRTACEALRWRDPKSAHLIAGWITLARIAGALPVRPHVWLTGGSGTGKSTVMDRIVRPSLGSPASRLYLQGGSTEAGVRQSVKADSLPIIFDEFETNGAGTQERISAMIELLRQSWSATQGHVVKGSASGIAAQYALSFAALVSSIRVVLDNDADRSRFSVLELAPHESNLDRWKELNDSLNAIDEKFGERLFARSVKMLPVILDNYKIFSDALAQKVSQRFGQQYGMLLAGWYSLLSDAVITPRVAMETIEEMGFSEEKSDASETDEVECLTHLLTSKVVLTDLQGHRHEKSVGDVIASGNSILVDSLKQYGILLTSDHLLIANEHAGLRRFIFNQTRWMQCWSRSLARLPGATKATPKWFGVKKSRATSIPTSLIK